MFFFLSTLFPVFPFSSFFDLNIRKILAPHPQTLSESIRWISLTFFNFVIPLQIVEVRLRSGLNLPLTYEDHNPMARTTLDLSLNFSFSQNIILLNLSLKLPSRFHPPFFNEIFLIFLQINWKRNTVNIYLQKCILPFMCLFSLFFFFQYKN